jgi:hypothetical protein
MKLNKETLFRKVLKQADLVKFAKFVRWILKLKKIKRITSAVVKIHDVSAKPVERMRYPNK